MFPPLPWLAPVGDESGPPEDPAEAATAAATAAAVAAAAAAAACVTDVVAIEIGGDAEEGTETADADLGELFDDCVNITLL